jgi:glycosyltransferase EpsE
MSKTISVILPVYNGGHLLRDAIQSVLNQGYTDFEFLICDDCSKDGSLNLINELCKDLDFVKIFKNESNLGLFKTLNRLLSYCTSPLIHLWSQDDVMKPTCLSSTIAFHQKHTQIGMSYSGRDLIDGEGGLISIYPEDGTPEIIDQYLYAKISSYWGCMAGNIANVTLTKAAVDTVGNFNENMKVSGDFEYWTRIATSYPIGFNNISNIFLRIHPAQLSHQISSVAHRISEDIIIMEKLLNMVKAADFNKINRCWKWKTQTMFFNEFIYLLRHRQWLLAKQSFNEISRISFIPTLALRWIVIKNMRMIHKEIWFYQKIIRTLN